MNSERNILSKLLEGCVEVEPTQPLDEKTYTVGDTQYWKRSGKFYSWTQAGGRKECSEDEYMKAISGGNGDQAKHTDPEKDAARKPDTKSEPVKQKFPVYVDGEGYIGNIETYDKDLAMLKAIEKGYRRSTISVGDPKKEEPSPIEQRRNAFYDDSESDHVHYGGVRDFDHTTWDIDGEEATIQRNPSGRGYYLQTEDYDEEFDTKGDLVHFLRSRKAEFIGEDSDSDY